MSKAHPKQSYNYKKKLAKRHIRIKKRREHMELKIKFLKSKGCDMINYIESNYKDLNDLIDSSDSIYKQNTLKSNINSEIKNIVKQNRTEFYKLKYKKSL